mgnify:CR=1 FL=1
MMIRPQIDTPSLDPHWTPIKKCDCLKGQAFSIAFTYCYKTAAFLKFNKNNHQIIVRLGLNYITFVYMPKK